MIALDRIQNADGAVFVLRYAEPDSIGSMGFRKTIAAAARISQIAAILDGVPVGTPGAPGIAQEDRPR